MSKYLGLKTAVKFVEMMMENMTFNSMSHIEYYIKTSLKGSLKKRHKNMFSRPIIA